MWVPADDVKDTLRLEILQQQSDSLTKHVSYISIMFSVTRAFFNNEGYFQAKIAYKSMPDYVFKDETKIKICRRCYPLKSLICRRLNPLKKLYVS